MQSNMEFASEKNGDAATNFSPSMLGPTRSTYYMQKDARSPLLKQGQILSESYQYFTGSWMIKHCLKIFIACVELFQIFNDRRAKLRDLNVVFF